MRKSPLPSGGGKETLSIAFNAPQGDVFTDSYTHEEIEMTNETKKLWKTIALLYQQHVCVFQFVSSLQSQSILKQKSSIN